MSLLSLFDTPPRVGSGSAVQKTFPQLEGRVTSSDQSLYFSRDPRFPVRKNCYILNTALIVEKDRLGEALQVLLFKDESVCQINTCSWMKAPSGHVLVTWVLGGVCFLRMV